MAREKPIIPVVKEEDGNVLKAGELVEFVKKFGAYMKLHTCLAYSAALKRTDVIDALLELAEYDLRHREVIKLFSRRNALILYEPVSPFCFGVSLPALKYYKLSHPAASFYRLCFQPLSNAFP